jgi:hypothetical protein
MKIGDRVVLEERVEMYKITYEIGHQFTIVGSNDMRGFVLRDDNGNMLCETRGIKMRSLAEARDKKINDILKDENSNQN